MNWEFELVAGPYGGTTEGPVWTGGSVLFTDIPGSRIMRYTPDSGEVDEYFTGTNYTNGLCFDSDGNLYGCQQAGRRIVHDRRGRPRQENPVRAGRRAAPLLNGYRKLRGFTADTA